MAPKKKKSGLSAQPSTLKAPAPTAPDAAGGMGTSEDMSAVGGVAGVGGTITTPPAADAGAEDTGGGHHQQRLDDHAPQAAGEGVTPSAPSPPTDEHSHSNGARSGANHHPPSAPTAGATAALPPPGRVDQTAALGGAIDPRAPPPRNPATQVVVPQLCGRGTTAVTAAHIIRS